MKRKLKIEKLFFCIIYLVFLISPALAQLQLDKQNSGFINSIDEQVFLFTDRDFYLSGEEVWFTAFAVFNNTSEDYDLSKVIYLELFDLSKKKFYTGKFEINGGNASGSFQIPEEIATGTYYIRVYTQYQRNYSPATFATKQITIVNPEYTISEQETSTIIEIKERKDLKPSPSDQGNEIVIKFQADKTIYGRREPVELNLQWSSETTQDLDNVCVSVIRKGTMRQAIKNNASTTEKVNSLELGAVNLFWIPETRGVSISGIVSELRSSEPLADIPVYLSVLGDQPQMHIAQTRANGSFIFSLGYISGSQEIFIGVEPDGEREVQLLVNNDFSNDFTHLQSMPHQIGSSYKALIEEMLVNHQAKRIFTPVETHYINHTQAGIEIFGNPDVSVYLTDYIDLPNLETVFFEVVHSAMVRDKDGERKLYVVNPETNKVFSNRLLLLDHVPVFNFEAILNIPPAKIENIDVINHTHYLGDNVLKSVVMMNTYAGDFAGYFFPEGSIFLEYQTITPSHVFHSPVYETQSKKDSRLPDFRTTLYWNPKISLSGNEVSVKFYTSDNSGEYDVIVRGVTKSGEVCFGQTSIEIK